MFELLYHSSHTHLHFEVADLKLKVVFFCLFLAIFISRMLVYAFNHGRIYAGLVDLMWKIAW